MAGKETKVVHIKLAMVEGFAGDWSMYMGHGHWDDEKVAGEGEKVSMGAAFAILSDLSYNGLIDSDTRQRLGDLHYRV